MRLERRKNAKRGMFFGFLNKIVNLILPFFVQTAIIKSIGAEYVGVRGLFSSILAILSLSELGFGSAIVYSMYKPIADDDLDSVGKLLKLYKDLYRLIGVVILILGLFITPFLKFLIKDTPPQGINIYVVFLLYLLNTVISYWMYAYKSSLLSAYQRVDVLSAIGIIVQSSLYILQIVLLFLLHNYYIFLSLSIIFTVINNIIVSAVVDRMFPSLKCKGKISGDSLRSIKKNVYGIFIGKVCGTTRNTFDSIFISIFLGLTFVAIYSNYFYILLALNGFTSIIQSSLTAGIGNRIALDSKEDNYKQMMTINTVYLVISGWMAVSMLCLYQPFMQCWVGRDLMIDDGIMMLFPIYFFIGKLGDIRGLYADGAGLFWENRFRSVLEAIANVVLNYLFVIKWGLFGIVLATIITLFFIGFIGSALVLFKHYYKFGFWGYMSNSLYYMLLAFAVGCVSWKACNAMNASSVWVLMFLRGAFCLFVVPIMIFALGLFRKDFRQSIKWALNVSGLAK